MATLHNITLLYRVQWHVLMDTEKGWLVLIVKTNRGWIHQKSCLEAYTDNLKTSDLSHHSGFYTCLHTQDMVTTSLGHSYVSQVLRVRTV